MNTAFYNGISGAKSDQTGINVWADNIANVNTVGFKANGVEFANLFSSSLAEIGQNHPAYSDFGLGVRVNSSPLNLSQGNFMDSPRVFDLAIQGKGWFGVQTGDKEFYTRNGSFLVNTEGFLVDRSGNYVKGKNAIISDDGKIDLTSNIDIGEPADQEKVRLSSDVKYPAKATDEVVLKGNIKTNEESKIFNLAIFTNENKKRLMSIKLDKKEEEKGQNKIYWDIDVKVRDRDTNEIISEKKGELIFDKFGKFLSTDLGSIKSEGVDIKIDMSKGFNNSVFVDSVFADINIKRNGFLEGDFKSYSINKRGEVFANFSNNKSAMLSKLAIYQFANEQGLEKYGSTNFRESSNSGEAMFFKDEFENPIYAGVVSNYKLESSNTDPLAALTRLLILQKSFTANSKSISTGNDLIKQALRMKT